MLSHTVAAIATAPGTGGIAVIRLSGPETYAIAKRVFKPNNTEKSVVEAKGYTALFGSFYNGETLVDTGVALFFRAPHSYTGEDVIELSCHGGEYVSRSVLQACFAAGAHPAGPGEFTKRAVLNGRLDLSQAEAVGDLISATSEQGIKLANQALQGSLYKKIQPVHAQLLELAGHLAAYTDYPDEDVEALSEQRFLLVLYEAMGTLQTLLAGYNQGAILRRGVQTAIVGSPNVGKSTLFNLLTGFDNSIVTSVAGTTRDVVRQQVQIAGVTLLLADTAGLHQTADIVEAEGIRRSYAELENAGLVIAVFDGSSPLQEEDNSLLQACRGRPALAVLNKADIGKKVQEEELYPYFQKVVSISAKQESYKPALEKAVLEVLQLEAFNPDAVLLANDRQFYAAQAAQNTLQQAIEAIQSGFTIDAAGVCLEEAIANLSSLTGQNASDAIIEDVFSRFCVGK